MIIIATTYIHMHYILYIYRVSIGQKLDFLYQNKTFSRISYTFLVEDRAEFHVFTCTGVVVGTELCNAESPALRDPTVWTFRIGIIIRFSPLLNEIINLQSLFCYTQPM